MTRDFSPLYKDGLARRLSQRTAKGDSCWLWTGRVDRKGYGRLDVRLPGAPRHRPAGAHRIAWLLAYGDPGKLCVCHRCDNPRCLRPEHLFLGTIADNNHDASQKGHFAKPHPGGRGERAYNAKLTSLQVTEIRRLSTSGWRLMDIAARFHITSIHACAVIKRRSWRWLP